VSTLEGVLGIISAMKKSFLLSTGYLLPKPVRSFLSRSYSAINGVHAKITGVLHNNSIRAFWANALNFGDLLTPVLLRHYGFTPVHVSLKDPLSHDTIVSAGSTLGWLPSDFRGFVVGTGFMCPADGHALPNAKILALRGELTKELAQVPGKIVLGDPGLLANQLVPSNITKKYDLGIIPHAAECARNIWRDKIESNVRDNRRVLIIDPRRFPHLVLRDIAQCDHIVSSSLHGLISADALGIPNGWISFDENLLNRFKFDDYYSALGINRTRMVIHSRPSINTLLSFTQRPVAAIQQRQNELDFCFTNLKSLLRS
jgi:pyruvyltransferase